MKYSLSLLLTLGIVSIVLTGCWKNNDECTTCAEVSECAACPSLQESSMETPGDEEIADFEMAQDDMTDTEK